MIATEDVHKMAVTTLFEFLHMSSFQRFMNQVLRNLDYVFVYVDDLLIASPSVEIHRPHLKDIFHRLSENGITINPPKCLFGVPKLNILSHDVHRSARYITNCSSNHDFAVPTSTKQM